MLDNLLLSGFHTVIILLFTFKLNNKYFICLRNVYVFTYRKKSADIFQTVSH